MGKPKQKKPKYRPVGGDMSQNLTVEAAVNSHSTITFQNSAMQSTVRSLTEKLKSQSSDERQCTCQTISGIVSEPGAADQFLSVGIVSALLPLLDDSCTAVRLASLRAFRNLSIDGGDQACQLMSAEQNLIFSLVNQLTINLSDDGDEPVSPSAIKVEVTIILNNLCSSCATAVQLLNQQDITRILLPLLVSKSDDCELRLSTAQLLLTLSEDNPDLCSCLSSSDNLSFLGTVISSHDHLTSDQLFFKIIICSVLCNVLCSTRCVLGSDIMATVVQLLCGCLDWEMDMSLNHVAEILGRMMPDTPHLDDVTHIKHSELEASVAKVNYLLNCHQVALETIANVFCSDEPDDEWEDEESIDSASDDFACSDETVDVSDMNKQLADCSMDCEITMSSDLHMAFLSSNIISKVFNVLNSEDLEICRRVDSHKMGKTLVNSTIKKLLAALGCINNLLVATDTYKLCELCVLHDKLFDMATALMQMEQHELLTEITGALHAVVKKLVAANSPKFADVGEVYLRALFEIAKKCNNSRVQANLVRVVGCVGSHIARQSPLAPQLMTVAEFLFLAASSDVELWILAEALDAIFDVFAEDETDPVLFEFQMVQKLKQLLPSLKSKFRAQKKCLDEHRPVISTVRANLSRFISYKLCRQNI